jgi:hypothetical protein
LGGTRHRGVSRGTGQINGTTTGRRNADVTLYDGENELTTLDRTMTIFP